MIEEAINIMIIIGTCFLIFLFLRAIYLIIDSYLLSEKTIKYGGKKHDNN